MSVSQKTESKLLFIMISLLKSPIRLFVVDLENVYKSHLLYILLVDISTTNHPTDRNFWTGIRRIINKLKYLKIQ